ncbi:DASH family cryptochrome [Lunatimonas salinarum]|uniref:DASH family cryptochrome n=1 Tax=Lunatimonas salinarum TaxID=1774590 RepID=UPI001ADF7B6C|nr:DASH family cryptochrome [Lunatimonas salinarum]
MKYKRAICWFRNDLRLHDNEMLAQALRHSEEVIPVFCIDPRSFQRTPLNLEKTGPFRANFIRESLIDLEKSLQSTGADLILLNGHPEEVLVTFAEQNQVAAIFFSEEVTYEEKQVEKALYLNGKKKGIATQSYWQATLFHPEDLPFPIPRLPEIFTTFRKACEKESVIRQLFPTPVTIPFPAELKSTGTIPSLGELGLESPNPSEKAVLSFMGGETQGLKRVEHYLWETDAIARYKQTRNGLTGADYSSKFSPWLAVGSLSPRWIYAEIRKYEKEVEKNDSTYWLIFELIWRDYFRFISKKHGDRIFKRSGIQPETRVWKQDNLLFNAWATGMTGIPFIDANMRELNQTGFMSNRGRQLVASFLANDMGLDWTWGAAYFESKLIDYDVCSNWANWMYVAGVGNDPRSDRYFNLTTQAKNYDPDGDYVRQWLPELSAIPGFRIHRPDLMAKSDLSALGINLGTDYPHLVFKPKIW